MTWRRRTAAGRQSRDNNIIIFGILFFLLLLVLLPLLSTLNFMDWKIFRRLLLQQRQPTTGCKWYACGGQVKEEHCNNQQKYFPGKRHHILYLLTELSHEYGNQETGWGINLPLRSRRWRRDVVPVINRQMCLSPIFHSFHVRPLSFIKWLCHNPEYDAAVYASPSFTRPGQCQCVCQNVEEQEKCLQVRN